MKYRTQKVTRTVPHTVGGHTEHVQVAEDIQVPVVPRDWDRTVLAGVSAVAVLILLAAIAWSTTSIGALLAMVVTPAVAYSAATVFDLAWIVALAVEWLSRYNTARSELPRNVGYVALAVAMAAVGVHGWLAGSPAVGIVGAVISGIAKVTWTLVLHYNAKPLDSRTQQWVDKRLADAGGRLALVTVQRQLARVEETVPAVTPVVRTAEDDARQTRDAILATAERLPDASTDDLVAQLARIGFDVTPQAVEEALERITDTPERITVHRDAHHDAPQVSDPNKTKQILAAASQLDPGASPSEINRILQRFYGTTVDEAYIRTVLSRAKKQRRLHAAGSEP